MAAYLSSKFPDRVHYGLEGIGDLLDELKQHGFTTLADIDSMINVSIKAVLAEEEAYPPSDLVDEDSQEFEVTKYTSVGLARTALLFMSEEYLNDVWGESRAEKLEQFRHLVKT